MLKALALRSFLVLTTLFLFVAPGNVHAADASSMAVVREFYASLLDTMKQGETLGFEGRYKKLQPEILKAFDLPLMTRYAAGPAWHKLSDADKTRLVDAFSRFSVATYAHRFPTHRGEVFAVLGERAASNGVMVDTTLTPKDEAPIALNYLVRKDDKGAPRIADVYLAASISELATRRAEFSAVLKREGLEALLSSLEGKIAAMERGAKRT